jgi:hypothetical protein
MPYRIEKIGSDLLRISNDRKSGSKLARFPDWAALRPSQEVAHAVRFLSSYSDPVRIRKRGKVIELPKRPKPPDARVAS